MIKLVSDTIDRDDIDSLIKWLSQDEIPRLTKGDLTLELESKWSKKIGTKYSVYVNSGSSAILLSLAALLESGRIKNKKIIVPGLSWATDVSTPILLGMEPIMCDCNLKDLSCDLNHLESLFKEHNPSSMILVSTLGLVPEMDESMGSKFDGKHLGSFGFASFFSMYFGHHLSTIEGGFINTDDEDFYHLLLMMRSHGWDRDLPKEKQKKLREKYKVSEFDSLYNFYVPGFNLRSTDLQAFIGLRSLEKLDKYSKIRNLNFKLYNSSIRVNELNLRDSNTNFVSNFAIPIVSKNKKEIVDRLMNHGIEVRPLIAGDMSKKPMWYERFGKCSLPNCEIVDEFGFYIPNHQDITEEQINIISNIINNE